MTRNEVHLDLVEKWKNISADKLTCCHIFHADPKFPDRLPDVKKIEKKCKAVGCVFLMLKETA